MGGPGIPAALEQQWRILVPEESDRLLVCDEKGFSVREQKKNSPGIVTSGRRSRGKVKHAESTFNHFSLLSFMPLSGRKLRPCVITPTARYNDDFGRIWPEAIFEHSPNGSCTSEIFVAAMKECCFDPMRAGGVTKPLLVVADSGGGAGRPKGVFFLSALHVIRLASLNLPANPAYYTLPGRGAHFG